MKDRGATGLEVSDRELVGRCLAGDRAAFDEIVRRYLDALYRHLLRLAGDREQAADFCQEAFLRFYRALATFDRTRPIAPFLFTIATNLWRDTRRPRLTVLSEEQADPSDAFQPEAEALAALQREEILAAVRQLRPEYQEVLSLRYDQGLSYREIAEVMGTTTGTVGTWLRRAVKALRAALELTEQEAAR